MVAVRSLCTLRIESTVPSLRVEQSPSDRPRFTPCLPLEIFIQHQRAEAHFQVLPGRSPRNSKVSSSDLLLQIHGHFDGDGPEADGAKQGLGDLVLPGNGGDGQGSAQRGQAAQALDQHGAGQPLTAGVRGDEDIVQASAGVTQVSPVALLQPDESVADDLAGGLVLGDQDDGAWVPKLACEVTCIAGLDPVDQHPAQGIEGVMHAHQLAGQLTDRLQILLPGVTDSKAHLGSDIRL